MYLRHKTQTHKEVCLSSYSGCKTGGSQDHEVCNSMVSMTLIEVDHDLEYIINTYFTINE